MDDKDMQDQQFPRTERGTRPDQDAGAAGQPIVALVRDLMFASRVRGAAPEAVTAHNAARVLESVGPATRLVIVELEAKGAIEAIEGAREKGVERIVAFAPHVMEELIGRAREAGAEVLTRGAFVKRLPDLVGDVT